MGYKRQVKQLWMCDNCGAFFRKKSRAIGCCQEIRRDSTGLLAGPQAIRFKGKMVETK